MCKYLVRISGVSFLSKLQVLQTGKWTAKPEGQARAANSSLSLSQFSVVNGENDVRIMQEDLLDLDPFFIFTGFLEEV